MSNQPLLWKFLLILAVVAGAAIFSYPPGDKINLGLDLRGGAHIRMQVDTDSAVRYEVEQSQSRLGNALKDAGVAYESIVSRGASGLEIRGTPTDRSSEVRDVLDRFTGGWTVNSVGGGTWRVDMPAEVRTYVATNAVEQTLSTIRNRIDSLGVAEPLVHKEGLAGDRILIQLPGVEDPERVKEILKDPAVLEWKEVSYPPPVRDYGSWVPPGSREAVLALFGGTLPDDTELIVQRAGSGLDEVREIWWPLKKVSTVVGNDLRNAFRESDQWGQAAVGFELSQEAGRRFEAATKANMGRIMAIVLGGVDNKQVVSAPVIEGVIRDRGIIRGSFSVEEAEDLSLKLKSGAIPTEVTIIEERTVGPSLGRDSIRAGVAAGTAGFVGVMLFMLIYYRLSGLNAVVALALNVLLVFGTLGALPFLFAGAQATLTLPGIAGLILTVGMAVDSNVLIFERIREELRVGKTVRSAVDQGFGKAFLTILDCNVTTLVAAFFLFSYGTGPVKGFAVTLTIGLLASMFTAVFVSRQLFELVLLRKQGTGSLSI